MTDYRVEDRFKEEHQRHSILEEVKAERVRQIGKWGTTVKHDVRWSPADWYEMISDYNGWARRMWAMNSTEKARKRFIQIAALAVAAVEVLDTMAAQMRELVEGLKLKKQREREETSDPREDEED